MSIRALRACALLLLAAVAAIAARNADDGDRLPYKEDPHLLLTRIADAPR